MKAPSLMNRNNALRTTTTSAAPLALALGHAKQFPATLFNF